MKLVIDDVTFNYKEIFSRYGEISALPGKAITHKDVQDADILIVRSRTKINRELLEGTQVKFIGSTVSGTDHVDLAYLQTTGITFTDAKGSNANAVAEYVIWNVLRTALEKGIDYRALTMGIIGVGCVGTLVADKADALGINIILNDPPRQITQGDTRFVSLEQVLQKSDILTFHTPLTTTGKFPTYHLLNEQNFHLVKPDAMIINAARGGVIQESAWLKHQGVKIVDCWENEPHIRNELRMQASLATPHIAGHSVDAKLAGSVMIDTALSTYLSLPQMNYKVENVSTLGDLTSYSLVSQMTQIYDFRRDEVGVQAGNFESYRRTYPNRYEWHNYGLIL